MERVIGFTLILSVFVLFTFHTANSLDYKTLRKDNVNQDLVKQAIKQRQAGLGRSLGHALGRLTAASRDGRVLVSGECMADVGVWLAALGTEEWAARMLDAWGTPESGYLEGDSVFEGSWPECSRVNDVTTGIRGRHCLTLWGGIMLVDGFGTCLPTTCSESDVKEILIQSVDDLEPIMPPAWKELGMNNSLVTCTIPTQEREITKDPSAMAAIAVLSFFGLLVVLGTIYDLATMKRREPPKKTEEPKKTMEPTPTVPEYRIPRPSINGSLPRIGGLHDIPSGYSSQADNPAFDYKSADLDPKSVPQGFVSYPPEDYMDNNNCGNSRMEAPPPAVLLPEIQRKPWQPDTCGKLMLAFSIRQHVPRILSFDHPKVSIQCLNGMRFLAFAWIVVGHTWVQGIVFTATPTVANKFSFRGERERFEHMMVKAHIYPVETFFVLSGMLTTISFLKKLQRKKPDCEMMGLYFFHRYWRLTPVYMLVLMFYGCLFTYLAAGPFFAVDRISDSSVCKTKWWTHLLYLNNLIDARGGNDCMGWTWYLANDFQFYVISPVFLFAIFYVPILGIILTFLAVCGGLIATIYINHQLIYVRNPDGSPTIDGFFGIYVKPWTRCTTYFMGMLLGYVLWKTNFKIKVNKGVVAVGWIAILALCTTLTYVEFNSICDGCTGWTGAGTIAFEGVKNTGMGLVNCWIIFACATGHGGFINSILSWNGWLPLARLSYAGYLFHPILIYFYFYQRPVQYYINDIDQAFLTVAFLFLSLGAAFIISLFLEAPFGALEKVMFANTPGNRRKPAGKSPPAPVAPAEAPTMVRYTAPNHLEMTNVNSVKL